MRLDLPVTAVLFAATLGLFLFASWRARQPAQPLKVRMINYNVVQILAIVGMLVFAAHLVTLITGHAGGGRAVTAP
jgi:hypothetical protein